MVAYIGPSSSTQAQTLDHQPLNFIQAEITMSWDEMWGYYLECNEEIQRKILKQIDLGTFLRNKAPKIQIEILQHAPQDIVQSVRHLLATAARKKLGVADVPNKNLPTQESVDALSNFFERMK